MRIFILSLMVTACTIAVVHAADQPHIVFILADDYGVADAGFQEQIFNGTFDDNVATPNLDALANQGVIFRNAYITGNICAPSRVGILSGVYQNRVTQIGLEPDADPGANQTGGMYNGNLISATGLPDLGADARSPYDKANGLRACLQSFRTMGSVLQDAGYKTGYYGKWHLGENANVEPANNNESKDHDYRPKNSPFHRGFDDAWYFNDGGGSDFFFGNNTGSDANNELSPVYHNEALIDPDDYLDRGYVDNEHKNNGWIHETELWTDEAIRFFNAEVDSGNPIFLYMAYNAVHSPLHLPDDPRSHDDGHSDREMLRAMATHMDEHIGELVAAIDAAGELDNTMFVFMSDNGGAGDSNNGHLKGTKHDDTEGGIRSPFFITWPGNTADDGTVIEDGAVISLDLFPTFAAVAGESLADGYDGIDLTPYLNADTDLPQRTMYWNGGSDKKSQRNNGNWGGSEAMGAVRRYDGKKLLVWWDDLQVYDLIADEEESDDLANDEALLIDLFTRWQLFLDESDIPLSDARNGQHWTNKPPKRQFKTFWHKLLPFVDASGDKIFGYVEVAAGDAYDINIEHWTNVTSEEKTDVVLLANNQPDVSFDVITATGGNINGDTFEASNTPGWVIIHASAVMPEWMDGDDRIQDDVPINSYLLVRVGDAEFPQEPDGETPSNASPVADASASPTTGAPPLDVDFSAAGSSDSDGSIIGYEWDFGDGASSTQANPSHTFSADGEYTVTLTVTDNEGATDSDTISITVGTPPATPAYPSGTPHAVPGTIQAEHYDIDGDGNAYADSDEYRGDSGFRSDELVDIDNTNDVDGDYEVDTIKVGEWLDYTVEVDADGIYDFAIRYSAGSTKTLDFRVVIDGEEIIPVTSLPTLGDKGTYDTHLIQGLDLTAGVQTMRIEFSSSGAAVNWVSFASGDIITPPGDSREIFLQVTPTPANLFIDGPTSLEQDTGSGATWEELGIDLDHLFDFQIGAGAG